MDTLTRAELDPLPVPVWRELAWVAADRALHYLPDTAPRRALWWARTFIPGLHVTDTARWQIAQSMLQAVGVLAPATVAVKNALVYLAEPVATVVSTQEALWYAAHAAGLAACAAEQDDPAAYFEGFRVEADAQRAEYTRLLAARESRAA